MGRRRDRMVERFDPSFCTVTRAAVGDAMAAMMCDDRAQELGIDPVNELDNERMLIDTITVGKKYWITTQTFPIVGVVTRKGIDYVEMDKAALILSDGRTSTLMTTGRAPNMEAEPIGDGVRTAVDQFGFVKEWPWELFTEAV